MKNKLKKELENFDFAMEDQNRYRELILSDSYLLKIHERIVRSRKRRGIITNDEMLISDRQWAEMSEPEQNEQRRIYWRRLAEIAKQGA